MTSGRSGSRGHRVREHIVIVGGPSNTFNGYGHWHQSETYHSEPRPADTSPGNMTKFLRGDPAHVVPGDPISEPTSTHDHYWANFLYAAVKLVELRGRVPEAITPAQGDLLTYLVWLPAYHGALDTNGRQVDRQKVDWDASPYNQARHGGSPYVGAKPYDPSFKISAQNTAPPRPQTPPAKKATTTAPVYGTDEPDINHEILMQTTAEVDKTGNALPDGGFRKRMHDPESYIDALTDLPLRLCLGSTFGQFAPVRDVPPLLGVFVKVLFVRDVAELFDYLNHGTWTGDRRLALTDLVDEDHMSRGDIDTCTWSGTARLKKGVKNPLWDSAPSVPRAKCKIRRLDYVGHSAPEDLFLQYGIENSKGEEPGGDITVQQDDMADNLDRKALASNAKIYLWGCFLGGTFAPKIAPLVQTPKSVRACIGRTTFDDILNAETALPSPHDPVNQGWVLFP